MMQEIPGDGAAGLWRRAGDRGAVSAPEHAKHFRKCSIQLDAFERHWPTEIDGEAAEVGWKNDVKQAYSPQPLRQNFDFRALKKRI
jgi:hypothetical protein